MNKVTPVLIVDAIEPALAFWEERFGFRRTIEVPHGSALGFVALQRGAVEVMLQTRASVAADAPGLDSGPGEARGMSLFIEVDDLEPVLRAAAGADIVVPERQTFYGMREIGVRAPGGVVVVFAQRVDS